MKKVLYVLIAALAALAFSGAALAGGPGDGNGPPGGDDHHGDHHGGHHRGHHKVVACIGGETVIVSKWVAEHTPGATLGPCPPPVEPPPVIPPPVTVTPPVVIPAAPSGVEGYGVCAVNSFVVNGHLVAVGEFAQVDWTAFHSAPFAGNVIPANFNASVAQGTPGYGLTCVTPPGSHYSGRLVSILNGAPADLGPGDPERIYPEFVAS